MVLQSDPRSVVELVREMVIQLVRLSERQTVKFV